MEKKSGWFLKNTLDFFFFFNLAKQWQKGASLILTQGCWNFQQINIPNIESLKAFPL